MIVDSVIPTLRGGGRGTRSSGHIELITKPVWIACSSAKHLKQKFELFVIVYFHCWGLNLGLCAC